METNNLYMLHILDLFEIVVLLLLSLTLFFFTLSIENAFETSEIFHSNQQYKFHRVRLSKVKKKKRMKTCAW